MKLNAIGWWTLSTLVYTGCSPQYVHAPPTEQTDGGFIDPQTASPPVLIVQKPSGAIGVGVATVQGNANRASHVVIEAPGFKPLLCDLNPSSGNFCADIPLPTVGKYTFTVTSLDTNGKVVAAVTIPFVYDPKMVVGRPFSACGGRDASSLDGEARCGPAP